MEVIKDRRWTLKIRSWKGTAAFAVHFYGTLERSMYRPIPDEPNSAQHAKEKLDISHQLTAAEARSLRAKDDWDHWKEGAWYTGFWDRESLVEAAKEAFARFADEGDFLVLNDGYDDEEIIGDDTGYESPWRGSTVFSGRLDRFEDITHDMEPNST